MQYCKVCCSYLCSPKLTTGDTCFGDDYKWPGKVLSRLVAGDWPHMKELQLDVPNGTKKAAIKGLLHLSSLTHLEVRSLGSRKAIRFSLGIGPI
jgi:hypothetical protein